jgi:hypothetical protein
MSMNKDAGTKAQRQSYNVTSRTIQVSNRAVYNNNNNNNRLHNTYILHFLLHLLQQILKL